MVATLRLLVISCACLLGWSQAIAICAIGVPPATRYVGDVATDNKCTDNDIQSAIDNVVCPGAKIVITGEHTYTAQHLSIAGKSLALIGSTSVCGDPGGATGGGAVPTSPVRTISGTAGGSVITISGSSNVTLQFLEITGGSTDASQSGGGVYFGGTGALTVDASTIDNNYAGYGGGIDVSPSGGSATLTLQNFSLILNNTAQFSGGGVRIEGATRMYMLQAASTISFNKALGFNPSSLQPSGGYGGGIEIIGPARADIGSPGVVFAGAVSYNQAPYGGGMAIIGVSAGDGAARIFTTDASTPVEISENQASVLGGAFYLLPDGDDRTAASLCALDFAITDNTAPDGAAIYGVDDGGGWYGNGTFLNAGGVCGPEPASSLGAVSCFGVDACNQISRNAAVDKNGNRSDGAIVSLHAYGQFDGERLAFRDNDASSILNLVFGFGSNSGAPLLNNYLKDCLIVDNHSTHEVIHGEMHFAPFTLDSCTVANNTIDNGYVIYDSAGLNLTHDLFAQSQNSTLDYVIGDLSFEDGCTTANCLTAQYIMASEIGSLEGPDNSLLSLNPLFLDATNSDVSKRDYHLQAFVQNGIVTASPAIDFAPAIANDGGDLDENPRDQDVPLIVNRFGMTDLGAYEMQPISDRIFADAFGDATSLVYRP